MVDYEWLIVAVFFIGLFGFFSILIIFGSEDISDYKKCIMKCPSNFNGEFDNLECLKMCQELTKESRCLEAQQDVGGKEE